jgi:CPA1 family monovalent cation:H+ antiporter
MPLSEVILIVVGLLTVAMLAAGICRNIPVPYTAFLVILGMLLGSAARNWPGFEFLLEFRLTRDVVLFLFLPALIFESAINLDARQLVKDLAPVLVLAVPALLLSTLLIGGGLWLVLDMRFVLALMFGALISATDPVAVIALFKELGAPHRLTVLVEGESLLNDATAIVVFTIILGLMESGSPGLSGLAVAVGDFLYVFLGGAVTGGVIGAIVSELLYRFRFGISAYLIMTIVLAYTSFTIAEHYLHVSGVMAVVAAAITMGALGVSRIPQAAAHHLNETWDMIALVCNSLLFLLVGLSVNTSSLINRIDEVLVAVVLVLLARACAVYSMVPMTTRLFRLPRVTLGEQHIMCWGGLKGGLAIAIALSIPEHIPGRDLLLDLTLGVVIFSLLVNAPTIRPLIHRLGIDRFTEDEQADLKHGLIYAEAGARSILERFHQTGLISRGTRELILKRCEAVFDANTPDVNRDLDRRHLFTTVLRAEMDELKYLYEIGLIEHYIYLDIRNNLQRDREWRTGKGDDRSSGAVTNLPGAFQRLENAIIKRMREHDWATGLLARYQYLRFSQSLQRDIAGVLTSARVLELLEQQQDHAVVLKNEVEKVYRDRLERRKQRLHDVALEFPDFYARFETRLISRVALNSAGLSAQESVQNGEIGAKVYAAIDKRIRMALSALPPITNPAPRLETSQLIGIVPLLNGLSSTVLTRLAQRATAVTFLANDEIIGEGEKGDALYIITHGQVEVFKEGSRIAELRDGDFFGEMALLGDQVRTATVKARIPTTLLRLTRRDVIALADSDPELKLRLEDAEEVRRTATP